MSDILLRNKARWLFNPWSIFLATYTTPLWGKPATPAFFTDGAITISPLEEFVEAEGYAPNSGVRYTMREDLIRFKLTVSYQIKEFVILSVQAVYGGSLDSAGTTLTFDGTPPPYFSLWAETCYNDDAKIVRLYLPRCKSTDTAEFATGDAHLTLPTAMEALPDIDDTTTLPSIYFEPA